MNPLDTFEAAVISKVGDWDDDDCNPRQGKQCDEDVKKFSKKRNCGASWRRLQRGGCCSASS